MTKEREILPLPKYEILPYQLYKLENGVSSMIEPEFVVKFPKRLFIPPIKD
jgi:hypothetical protein